MRKKLQIVSWRIRGQRQKKEKNFVTLHVGTREAVGFIIINLSMYIIYTQIQRCTHARARPPSNTHTHTHARTHARTFLSTYMRLEFFYKYYKETVIHVHDMCRRVSKEGLITQAPFLRLPRYAEIEKTRERECKRVWMCIWERKRERKRTQCFWIFGSLPLITFQTHLVCLYFACLLMSFSSSPSSPKYEALV